LTRSRSVGSNAAQDSQDSAMGGGFTGRVPQMCTRFTLDGSDQLEHALSALCEQVVNGVQIIVPPQKLHAIALGGGYGRGEGGVLRDNAGDHPYNDLEFYVFIHGNRLWNENTFRKALHVLEVQLSNEARLHVEFKIDSLRRFRQSAVSMFSYD